jgi:alkylhydroperoxidase/carboxymuconolactone decarboxylase family protein YurZ
MSKVKLDDDLRELARGAGPLGETVIRMNLGALDQPGLDEATAVAARFGALVAMDASPASYLVHMTLADQTGIRPETVKAILATLAPLVGSARVVSAADKVLRAIELADRL